MVSPTSVSMTHCATYFTNSVVWKLHTASYILSLLYSYIQVGIPNSRLRYFLIAKMSTENFSSQVRLAASTPGNVGKKCVSLLLWIIRRPHCKLFFQILDAFPHPAESDSPEQPMLSSPPSPAGTCQPEEEMQVGRVLYKVETSLDAQTKMSQNKDLSVRQIQDFLEPQMGLNVEHYLLPPKTLLRYALLLDIVRPTCRRSVCFTKGWVQQPYSPSSGHFYLSIAICLKGL